MNNLLNFRKLLVILLAVSTMTSPLLAVDLPELSWEKRSDWIDVKTDVTPAAKGDGVADDTEAIQAAFNKISHWEKDGPVGGPKTVYLPAGTYRITKTINMPVCYGLSLIGQGRKTVVSWDGETSPTVAMYQSNGCSNARYEGIVWNGNGKAAFGFRHNGSLRGGSYETQNMHKYEAFLNFTAKGMCVGDAESPWASDMSQIENCIFQNCGIGISVEQFNYYHYPIIDCVFLDCGTGAYFKCGMGYVRNCHFERSKEQDILTRVGHPNSSSIRCSSSFDSKRFITCTGYGWTCTFYAMDCQVSGWKDTEGAIVANNAGTMIFSDITFSNPPSKNAPIKLINKYPTLLTVSNLKSPGTDKLIDPGSSSNIVEVPAGKVKPLLTDAKESFFRDQAVIPGKIFDAKREFGAKADGKADDTDAIQKTIDAARAYGKGSMAYLPTGKYKVSKTLVVTGSDYYIGGSGTREHCVLTWDGPNNGIVFSVQNPQNLNMQYLYIVTGASKNQVCAIQQQGTGGTSKMCYEVVQVPGGYEKATPRWRGFEFTGLGKGDVVIGKGHLGGDMRITNCGRATIVIDSFVAAPLVIEGAEPVRDGFIGFHAFMGLTCGDPLINVKNNQNLVVAEAYIEQTVGAHVGLEGNPGEPSGYVTIFGSERYTGPGWNTSVGWKGKREIIWVNNYQGRYCEGGNGFDYPPAGGYLVNQKGERKIDMLFLANCWMMDQKRSGVDEPVFELDKGGRIIKVQNTISNLDGADKPGDRDVLGTFPEHIPNVIPEGGLERVSDALDDLRRLSLVDMGLKHPEALQAGNQGK